MNAIIGFADILTDCKLSEKENEYVHLIKIAGENLLTIINDILDFSKIESKWQKSWEAKKVFEVKESSKKKFYVLDMFAIYKTLSLTDDGLQSGDEKNGKIQKGFGK